MPDCLINIDPDTVASAGPFMGAALAILIFQTLVIVRIKHIVVRLILVLGSSFVLGAALLGGIIYAFIHGV